MPQHTPNTSQTSSPEFHARVSIADMTLADDYTEIAKGIDGMDVQTFSIDDPVQREEGIHRFDQVWGAPVYMNSRPKLSGTEAVLQIWNRAAEQTEDGQPVRTGMAFIYTDELLPGSRHEFDKRAIAAKQAALDRAAKRIVAKVHESAPEAQPEAPIVALTSPKGAYKPRKKRKAC